MRRIEIHQVGAEKHGNFKNLKELNKKFRRLCVLRMEDHQVLRNMVESTTVYAPQAPAGTG